jgi:hypothetical protein
MAESPVEQNTFSLNFSYVCPEPGLVKSSLCVQNGSTRSFSAPADPSETVPVSSICSESCCRAAE